MCSTLEDFTDVYGEEKRAINRWVNGRMTMHFGGSWAGSGTGSE